MKTPTRVYLDNAATTAIRPEVIDAMTEVLQSFYGNPSSIHADGRKARSLVEQARKTVAYNIGASIGEIFFTSGGTESNNTALKCAVRDLGVRRIISSPIEHHCILHTLDRLRQTDEIECLLLDVNELGQPDLKQLAQLLADDSLPTLVSLMHSNNEIGTINDIEKVAELCANYKAYFHTDSV
ncbi:MAG: aminotransferase class V-fold PLP-dependent enzyme, partial [Bacteroidota bacterium]